MEGGDIGLGKDNGGILRDEYGDLHPGKIVGIFIAVMILLMVFFFGMTYGIGVGDAGLLIDPITNSVSEPIVGPTWGIKMPWQGMRVFPYARESLGMWGDGTDEFADFPCITGITVDGLRFKIDVLVRWSIDTNRLKALYESYPAGNWETITMASLIREETRDEFAKFTAIQVVEEREMVALSLEERLIKAIEEEPSLKGAITNLELELRDLEPPKQWLGAIEAKLTAEQERIQALHEKERTIILSEAEAESLQIKAEGEANATRIRARGLAEALEEISNRTGVPATEITKEYVAWSYLKDIASTEGTYFLVTTGAEGQPYIYQIPQEQG